MYRTLRALILLQGNLKTSNINPEERQIARKRHLKEYCHKHTFNKSPRPEEFLQLAVDDELKLIYCVIPKVGTKTWKRVLVQPRGLQPGIHRWDAWKRLSSYTAKERKQRLESYFKFVFVREPLGRLLSAYKDRLIKHSSTTRKERRNIVKAYRPQEFKPNGKTFVSFREFIQYYSDNKTRNQHWRQYEKLCHPCIIDYNFIGHLETLAEDAPLLLKMAGIDGRVTFPPVHNSTGSSEVLKYFSQVPSEYITRIGELYRSDFEMFGYEYLGAVRSLLKRA